jgi:hypothetical protein
MNMNTENEHELEIWNRHGVTLGRKVCADFGHADHWGQRLLSEAGVAGYTIREIMPDGTRQFVLEADILGNTATR